MSRSSLVRWWYLYPIDGRHSSFSGGAIRTCLFWISAPTWWYNFWNDAVVEFIAGEAASCAVNLKNLSKSAHIMRPFSWVLAFLRSTSTRDMRIAQQGWQSVVFKYDVTMLNAKIHLETTQFQFLHVCTHDTTGAERCFGFSNSFTGEHRIVRQVILPVPVPNGVPWHGSWPSNAVQDKLESWTLGR